MKTLLVTMLAMLLLTTIAGNANAQTPYMQVYFDPGLTYMWENCPPAPIGTVVGTMYVVAHDFGAWLSGIEFRIDYPPQLLWLGDTIDTGHLSIGNTRDGIGITFPQPLDAFSSALIVSISFLWMCQDCNSPDINSVVCFNVFPGSGCLRAVRWPDLKVICGQSGTAIICPVCGGHRPCDQLPVPVEQTTWGGIKALYH